MYLNRSQGMVQMYSEPLNRRKEGRTFAEFYSTGKCEGSNVDGELHW